MDVIAIMLKDVGDRFQNKNPEVGATWSLLSIAADALEDAGRHADAECARWCVANAKRPYVEGQNCKFIWFNAARMIESYGDTDSDLPEAVWRHVQGGKAIANQKGYDEYTDAMFALFSAMELARAEGFVPESQPARA